MRPATMTSSLQQEIQAAKFTAEAVFRNLADQHDWTSLELLDAPPPHPRPLIRGLPPKRLYLHPDDQIAALEHEQSTGEKLVQNPEQEWVLALRLAEKWSLSRFASVFDSIPSNGRRPKRIVLATLHDDSTIVYYIMQEGMIKPRQN